MNKLPSRIQQSYRQMEIMDTNINRSIMEKYEMVMNSLKQDEERIMFCETKVREMDDLQRQIRTLNS